MQSLSIDPVIFFIVFSISIALWGFIIGAMSCCIPELIPIGAMFIEALILGLGGALAVDFIFCSNIPVVNQVIGSICTLFQITQTQLEVVIACLLCLVIIGAYLWIWNVCPISQLSTSVKILGGGSLVVSPPLLFSWFIATHNPYDNETNSTNAVEIPYQHSFSPYRHCFSQTHFLCNLDFKNSRFEWLT